jgi:hypothetical protein
VRLRFLDYESSRDVPNIVVDGSPNEATVLTLTHWPGISQPPGLAADLSAQMAFAYAHSEESMPAEVVTNNHFDQDGLIAMYALIEPELARQHEDLLVDIAAAGDFGTYRYRSAARASMALAGYADTDRSPIAADRGGPYEAQCAVLYEYLLGQILQMALNPEEFEELWVDEDRQLTATEGALAKGDITIEEFPDIDLAVIDIPGGEPSRSGHRFALADGYIGAHPMAVNNATDCFRILQVHGRHYTYTDRYESWVQYHSRRPMPRVDLRPLAEDLTSRDSTTEWTATAPSSLTAQLRSLSESSLDRSDVLADIAGQLRSAEPAWNPYQS